MLETSTSTATMLGGDLIAASTADVGQRRERQRLSRLRVVFALFVVPFGYLWYRILTGLSLIHISEPTRPY